MQTPVGQPTPENLKKMISDAGRIIKQYEAKGLGDPDRSHQAQTDLAAAEQALEAGNYDHAKERFGAAMDYLSTMAIDAVDDLKRRL